MILAVRDILLDIQYKIWLLVEKALMDRIVGSPDLDCFCPRDLGTTHQMVAILLPTYISHVWARLKWRLFMRKPLFILVCISLSYMPDSFRFGSSCTLGWNKVAPHSDSRIEQCTECQHRICAR